MSYEIDVDDADGILRLTFHGEGEASEHIESRLKAFKTCQEHKINKMLVDLRDAVMDMSNQELFEFGSTFQRESPPAGIRIAVLTRENDSAANLAIAVAQAKRFEMHVFLTEADARSWLTA